MGYHMKIASNYFNMNNATHVALNRMHTKKRYTLKGIISFIRTNPKTEYAFLERKRIHPLIFMGNGKRIGYPEVYNKGNAEIHNHPGHSKLARYPSISDICGRSRKFKYPTAILSEKGLTVYKKYRIPSIFGKLDFVLFGFGLTSLSVGLGKMNSVFYKWDDINGRYRGNSSIFNIVHSLTKEAFPKYYNE